MNSFFLTTVIDGGLESLIKEMNTSKSVYSYNIATSMLKLPCLILPNFLVKLINFLFCEGIFPDLLKLASVIPVFKKADNLNYNNCRPISLTSNIGNLIEKVLLKRLILSFSSSTMDLDKVSTNHALVDITNRIQEDCDFGYKVDYVNFNKTLDTMNYGVAEIKNNWYKT